MRFKQPSLAIFILVLATLLMACAPAATPTPAATKAAPAPTTAPAKPAATASAAASPAAKPAASPSAAPKAEVKPLSPAVKVNIGSIGTLGGMAYFIAAQKGYYKDEGLDVEFVNFKTAGDMIPALSRGDVDVGSGAINAGLFNAIAREISLKLVAEPSTVELSEGLMVRTDLADQIKDWKDLKGRKVALSSTASSQEIALDTALKKGGLTLKDVDVQTMGFPDMLVAFGNKAIDVADVTEPTITQGVEQKLFVRWKLGKDIDPTKQVGVLMYSAKFVQEKNEAAKRYMYATLRAGRDYYEFVNNNRKFKDDVYAAAANYTTTKDTKLYDTMNWSNITTDMKVKTASIKDDVDWYVKMGYVKDPPRLEDAIDNSFTDYANQRLGPYKP